MASPSSCGAGQGSKGTVVLQARGCPVNGCATTGMQQRFAQGYQSTGRVPSYGGPHHNRAAQGHKLHEPLLLPHSSWQGAAPDERCRAAGVHCTACLEEVSVAQPRLLQAGEGPGHVLQVHRGLQAGGPNRERALCRRRADHWKEATGQTGCCRRFLTGMRVPTDPVRCARAGCTSRPASICLRASLSLPRRIIAHLWQRFHPHQLHLQGPHQIDDGGFREGGAKLPGARGWQQTGDRLAVQARHPKGHSWQGEPWQLEYCWGEACVLASAAGHQQQLHWQTLRIAQRALRGNTCGLPAHLLNECHVLFAPLLQRGQRERRRDDVVLP